MLLTQGQAPRAGMPCWCPWKQLIGRLAHWTEEMCLEGLNLASFVLIQMAQTVETAQETIGFLDQTLYRWDRLCMEALASRQLAQELLTELRTHLVQAR